MRDRDEPDTTTIVGLSVVVRRTGWGVRLLLGAAVWAVVMLTVEIDPVAPIASGVVAIVLAAAIAREMRRWAGPKRTIVVDRDELRVGAAAVPISIVHAALYDPSGPRTLRLLDRWGRVLMHASGGIAGLDQLDRAVARRRHDVPLRASSRSVLVVAGAVLLAAVAHALVAAAAVATVVTAGLAGLAAALLMLSRPPRVEIGVDGLLHVSAIGSKEFFDFEEIARLETSVPGGGDDRIVVTTRSGEQRTWRFRYPGSAARVKHALDEHRARDRARDTVEAARRRIALDDAPAPAQAYRVVLDDDLDCLGDAALDSTEPRSLRIRAARRLAVDSRADAARARERVREHVVDPDIHRELRGLRPKPR